MNTFYISRLTEERKQWRIGDRPFGFYARPGKNNRQLAEPDEVACRFSGQAGKAVSMIYKIFPEDYPQRPPTCVFTPPIFQQSQHLSLGYCVPLDFQCRAGLEAIHHREANSDGNSGSAHRSEHQIASADRSVHAVEEGQ
ncbi:E2 SUMO-conjugating protein ubc9, partial [Podochytrium sp. JEL0797]